MQMTMNVNESMMLKNVGFISNDYLLVCVRTACASLINTDFFVLKHILNFIRRKKYKTFSTHS